MKPSLKVTNLTKQFANFTAVDSVSFEALPGQIFGLLGPNGAGKTTTLRVIATILAPSSGSVEIAGYKTSTHPEEARKRLGMLTTEVGVYDRFSGRENLEYFGRLYGIDEPTLKQRIEELIRVLSMEGFIEKRAGKYSTGMKQKLAIARSVIHDPEVIIFDEPTSGLDVLASQTVLNFMHRSREAGKCVVLSTHQMPDAEKLCDRVAIIHQGRVIANETIAAIQSATQTNSLEDAFLRMVEGQPKDNAKPHTPRVSFTANISLLPRWVWTLAVLACVGLFFFFEEWQPLENFRWVGIAFLVLGILISLADKFYFKRLRR